MKTKTTTPKPAKPIESFPCCFSSFAVFCLLALLTGCLSANFTPVVGVPIVVDERGIYKTQRTFAYYRDNALNVEADFTLVRGVILAPNASFNVKVFDASGKEAGNTTAKFSPNDKTSRNDMRLNASFRARIQVPLSQVARIEAHYILPN